MGLAELLVTLALFGVVMATATHGLARHLRLHRERDAQFLADETVREVYDVLRGELAHAGDVRVIADTAVDLAAFRIVAPACDASAARLVIAASETWWSPPRAGDSLAMIDTVTRHEWRTTVASTGTQRASVPCPAGGTRLTLSDEPPFSVPALLVPVRVWRTARYMIYRASDGTWWLGERSCTPGCGAAQPIAGPLLSPTQGGLSMALVTDADARALALDVAIRATVGVRSSVRAARIPVTTAP